MKGILRHKRFRICQWPNAIWTRKAFTAHSFSENTAKRAVGTQFGVRIQTQVAEKEKEIVSPQDVIWAPSSEFVSSSIPSLQILIAHAQPFRGARDLVFCLKVPLDSLLVWASSGGSGETARMRRLAWTFAARIGDKYQIRLTRPI